MTSRDRSFSRGLAVLRQATGVVIPVFVPPGVDAERAASLLADTVTACCSQVADPQQVCLGVDGADYGEGLARRIAQRSGAVVSVAPRHRGKLEAVRVGMQRLLARSDLRYMAVVDQDGDHFANELLNLVRAAEWMVAQTGDARVVILGRRLFLHRSLGFLRGELERLADYVLVQALRYRAALRGEPLKLAYATHLDLVPDFHSGYKLFSRAVAGRVFTVEPPLMGLGEEAVYRHACEAVMVVEPLLAGARLGAVNRTAVNVQPISTFRLMDRAQLTADMILWPCRRLEVPAAFVRRWLAEALSWLQLPTLAPQGREELAAVCRLVLAAYASGDAAQEQVSLEEGPLFV
ncbi:MAG TPA: hypothetical protein ENL34_04910 [Chloroflexi bacterium]|nr:hypothetical protein [Chloroflexota bacterium]